MSRNRITIGRAPGSDIRVPDSFDTVSNSHADIELKNGALEFIDHSSNGTTINGQKVHNTTVGIYPGDDILLAKSYAVEWPVIESFFPGIRRPTVTRNTHGDEEDTKAAKPATGRKTEMINTGTPSEPEPERSGGRKTEQFDGRSRENLGAGSSIREPRDENFGVANEYSQSEIDREVGRWNWGAFLGSWLWAPFNGVWWPLAILLVLWVPYLSQVLQLCLCVYLGLTGSRLAWRSGRFRSFGAFKKSQQIWLWIGIIVFAGCVVGNIFILDYTLLIFF